MRRTIVLSAVLTVLVVATGVAVAASSPGSRNNGGDHGNDGRFHVLRVERNAGTDVVLDLDHSGSDALTVGDEIVSTAEFFIGDREVGKDGVVCTKVRVPEWFQCVATNSFEDGDLTVQFLGDFTSPEPGRFAITGGTRAYFGATGEVTFVDNPAPARDESRSGSSLRVEVTRSRRAGAVEAPARR
jgi:hypothetical protein